MDLRSPRKQPGGEEPTAGSSQSCSNNVLYFSVSSSAGAVPDYVPAYTNSNAVGPDPRSNKPQDPPPAPHPKKAKTPALRERELNYALFAAHRNLTRISQYVLKLEARANIATQEDERLTIEATFENNQHSSRDGSKDRDLEKGDYHAQLIEDVSRLGDQVWNRMFLVDKHFTHTSRKSRKEVGGKSGPIQLRSESHTKNWLNMKLESNAPLDEETLFYTVWDMAKGRPLSDWFGYIRDMLRRRDNGEGDGPRKPWEGRVVAVAWPFLDRAIRPPRRPRVSTTVMQFIVEWDSLRRRGAFDQALENPGAQRESDAEILESLKLLWSAQERPL